MNENVLTEIGKRFVFAVFAGGFLTLCVGACAPQLLGAAASGGQKPVSLDVESGELPDALIRLYALASPEKSEGFPLGMGLAESSLRQREGNYAGSTFAAFKELLYARGCCAIIDSSVKARLMALVSAFAGKSDRVAEADSFARWMALTCPIEEDSSNREVRNAYAFIRARYECFPECWYRAARATLGAAAERCVAIAPNGYFAREYRAMMAEPVGLSGVVGPKLLCRAEIEECALETAVFDPEPLEKLYPTSPLLDNPNTFYAFGAHVGFAANFAINNTLAAEGRQRSGCLGERLRCAAGR